MRSASHEMSVGKRILFLPVHDKKCTIWMVNRTSVLSEYKDSKMSDTVRVKSCASREEADFLQNLLEVNGVHAMVSEDNYVGVPLSISNGVGLLVLNEYAEVAHQILEELDSKTDGDGGHPI